MYSFLDKFWIFSKNLRSTFYSSINYCYDRDHIQLINFLVLLGREDDGNGGDYLWSVLVTLPYLLYCFQCGSRNQSLSLYPSKQNLYATHSICPFNAESKQELLYIKRPF